MPNDEASSRRVLEGHPRVRLSHFIEIADRCERLVQTIHRGMLAPQLVKEAPISTTNTLASLTGLSQSQINYRCNKGELPYTAAGADGRRKSFTLEQVRAWAKEVRKEKLKPAGAEAVTVAVANFKGGVTKTTTAVTLAQGLALRGHKVLLIDADPQGSATTLFGIIPDKEVAIEDTILPLCTSEQTAIDYAIRKTYWEGLDLVPAMSGLFSAEFDLPSRQMTQPGFQFWNVLHNGIDAARLEYDVIIIDTPPSLSYLTINAIMAADGILLPMPPSALDFLSSTQFWGLVTGLTGQLHRHGHEKEFDFVSVLLTKVDEEEESGMIARKWITAAYMDKVMKPEIPKTATAGSASAEFGTVYDQPRKRVTADYDRMVEDVENQIGVAWLWQISPAADATETP